MVTRYSYIQGGFTGFMPSQDGDWVKYPDVEQLQAENDRLKDCVEDMRNIICELEYSAYNLCEKTDEDVNKNTVDSTCPESTMFIAMRRLSLIANKLEGKE
jgi:hypothetical protein